VLVHGTTLHGVKSLAPGEETLPMAYYSREGPFGRFFDSQSRERLRKIGVIGLGAGDLACYAAPGQEWSFFEIDPVSVSFADKYFGFIRNCGNDPKIIIGDARLELARSPDAYFDLLILDAFSSDAIPIHLLTREAMALYLHKLAPKGVLLFHVSSRNLDLPKVVGALAADAGLAARIAVDPSQAGARLRRIPAIVVAMAKDSGRLDGLGNWSILPSGDEQSLWTDQRSDLLHVIRFTPWF
jgi:spermidine synthase